MSSEHLLTVMDLMVLLLPNHLNVMLFYLCVCVYLPFPYIIPSGLIRDQAVFSSVISSSALVCLTAFLKKHTLPL